MGNRPLDELLAGQPVSAHALHQANQQRTTKGPLSDGLERQQRTATVATSETPRSAHTKGGLKTPAEVMISDAAKRVACRRAAQRSRDRKLPTLNDFIDKWSDGIAASYGSDSLSEDEPWDDPNDSFAAALGLSTLRISPAEVWDSDGSGESTDEDEAYFSDTDPYLHNEVECDR